MRHSQRLIMSLVLLATLPTALLAKSAKDEWLPGEKLQQALELGAEKDVPVAVIYQFKESSCPLHRSRVGSYENLRELKGMIKVRTYTEDQTPGLREARGEAFTYMLPVLFINDGEGHLIGFAAYKSSIQDLTLTAKQAAVTMKWKQKTRKTLRTIEQQIQRKQFSVALKQLGAVANQDRKLTYKLKKTIETANKIARKTRDSRLKKKPGEEEAATRKKEDKDKLVVTEGMFFAEQVSARRTQLAEAVGERCDEAEGFLASGEPRKAALVLRPLRGLNIDQATDTRIKELGERLRDARKPKPAAKEGSSPESDASSEDEAEKPASTNS